MGLFATLLSFLQPYYPIFVERVIDTLLEEITSGMENNIASMR